MSDPFVRFNHTVDDKPIRIRIRDVQAAAERVLKVPHAALVSHDRRSDWLRARTLAMAVAAEVTGASAVMIATAFGGRDHVAVLSAQRSLRDWLAHDPDIELVVTDIKFVAASLALKFTAQMRSIADDQTRRETEIAQRLPVPHRESA